ncbi:myocardin-related transcription factor A [Gastrophryne carolinensis]
MPPLKSPASFHEQRRSLERARTEDYLKRKIRCRPERSELVRMHILEETSAEPSLQAKQLKLKRARLADDLNEKISQRPGPMELVVKNILPVENSLKEALIDGDYSKVADGSSFDEDSSDALSPEQPASQDSQGSVPSPSDLRANEGANLFSPTQVPTCVQLVPELKEKSLITDTSQNIALNNGISIPATRSLPALIKQSQSKPFPDKSQRTKKTKEPKPKVKKLKYHQYIPPDQKQKGTLAMDSSYAKILQQQQLFLQLQILNQQQQHYNYHTILPAPPKPLPEQAVAISSTPAVLALPTISTSNATPPSLVRQNSNVATFTAKTGRLPHNLDDMKVAELKQELKHRGLHVSGTKVDLIERLKATQDLLIISSTPLKSTANQPPKPNEMVPVAPNMTTSTESTKLGSFSSTPPCSPCPSEVSMTSVEETATSGDPVADTVSPPVTPLIVLSSPPSLNEKSSSDAGDKDIMLREKDRQIEELTRRLKQKQELVERLRLQLEQEKKQVQNCIEEHTAKAPEKQKHGNVGTNPVRESSKPVMKSELMYANCQQDQKVFVNTVPNANEGKINGPSAAQLVFTLSGPNPLLSDDNQQVVLQEVPAVGLKVDDFFDVLMHNLDLDAASKEFSVPTLKQSPTSSSVDLATQSEMTSLPPSATSGHLEDFLEASTGTQILQGDQDVTASLPLIDDLHSQMLSNLAILDHPNSAMYTSDMHFSSGGGSLGLDISEPPLDGMDWLELSGPPAMNLTPLSTVTPSVFCTDFLDSHDLQLHWDSCL